jgi:hypothetical protein
LPSPPRPFVMDARHGGAAGLRHVCSHGGAAGLHHVGVGGDVYVKFSRYSPLYPHLASLYLFLRSSTKMS